ncbi:MAG TPA: hypothetical protein PKN22_01700 [Taishania sp.]|nr:hypothetical protein [Taishania sp.]
MNIVEIAEKYFKVNKQGNGTYRLSTPDGKFDTVVLWEATNSYHRFSTGYSGGPFQFLKYIVGLNDDEIKEEYGESFVENALVKALTESHFSKSDTGYTLQDVVFELGYNEYIKSRNISKETAEYFNLEVSDKDVIIPLYDRNKRRIGSLVRNHNPKVKGDRYRTMLIGSNEKPCVWSFSELYKIQANSIIILVEGAWSVMRIHQVIKPLIPNILPIATLGTNIHDELKQYIYDYPIISILDDDEGGNHVHNILQQWKKEKINVKTYIPTFSIVSKVSSSYVDDISDKMLIELFRKIIN